MGVNSKNFAKVGYVCFQAFWVLISILLLFTARHLVDILPSFLQCPEESGGATACMGPSAIIRMSFVLACLHVLIFCVILARNTAASIFHDGCWGIKFLLVFSGFIATLWIDNGFFRGYMDFARIVAILFLLVQALLMLVVAYKVNELLVGNYESESSDGLGCSGIIVIILTVLLTAGNITWLIFQYIWFSGCTTNNFIITITVVASIASYAIVFFRTREDASILTSSIVVSYLCYLQWSALSSRPNDECNPFENSNANTVLQIVIGTFITVVSLMTISTTTRKSDKENLTTRINAHMMEDEEDDHERIEPVTKSDGKIMHQDELHSFPITSATIFFQALLILAAVYYSMLLTNWGNPTIFDDTSTFYSSNNTSFWIKLSAQWLSTAIYLFSQFAPMIFPDREF
ncbi:hypothetical protein FGO68_gene8497 [Halteria grandinella]|uniref:Uncharacterized protein n=1 Tax=Halteria grandinella TaxID=5974 RepID=A0A8J8P4F5_HALGN|nr:hypothetical protein FGO68_gene8497 [Halteria grandinella]